MFFKQTKRGKKNISLPMDSFEKLEKNQEVNPDLKEQFTEILSAESWLNMLLGGSKSSEKSQRQEISLKRGSENVIFQRQENREKQALNAETQELVKRLNEQLKVLGNKENKLASNISKIKVEQLPDKSSIYFLRYLEWIIKEIRKMIQKVDNASKWLATFQERKQKKGFWLKAKKHGTSFSMSMERKSDRKG